MVELAILLYYAFIGLVLYIFISGFIKILGFWSIPIAVVWFFLMRWCIRLEQEEKERQADLNRLMEPESQPFEPSESAEPQWEYHTHHHLYSQSDRPTLQESLAILGVSYETGQDELAKIYQTLIKQYDPEQLTDRNLPDELIELMVDKRRQLTIAYHQIIEHHGWTH